MLQLPNMIAKNLRFRAIFLLSNILLHCVPAYSAASFTYPGTGGGTFVAAPLQTLELISQMLRPVGMRLPSVRYSQYAYAASGDALAEKRGIWVRPFNSRGHQFGTSSLQGYTAKTNGFAFGFDTDVTMGVTLGIAGNLSKSTVTQDDNSLSFTNISNYQAIAYGTIDYSNNSYLDWFLVIGNDNYSGTRNIPLASANTVSEYSGQQYTAKVIGSQQWIMCQYYVLTPFISGQYSFVRNPNFEENGAGEWNTEVTQDNLNLFRLGIGSEFSAPLNLKNVIATPAVHAAMFVDAIGGVQNSSVVLVNTTTTLLTSVSQNRLMLLFGASITIALQESLEVSLNYDYAVRRRFNGYQTLLNLRYKF